MFSLQPDGYGPQNKSSNKKDIEKRIEEDDG